jgi:hypothetical protein
MFLRRQLSADLDRRDERQAVTAEPSRRLILRWRRRHAARAA